ncbi:hypothetical protein E2C01_095533 [Portunus trituberculatus]|uniref:Uncharacterized protein n=1 Tax=Portunus trituberculatus TaxID=210409 RepID=A0A5B7K0E4_PORTR|nr:hypothetical protein [Portunus trituberculatus]
MALLPFPNSLGCQLVHFSPPSPSPCLSASPGSFLLSVIGSSVLHSDIGCREGRGCGSVSHPASLRQTHPHLHSAFLSPNLLCSSLPSSASLLPSLALSFLILSVLLSQFIARQEGEQRKVVGVRCSKCANSWQEEVGRRPREEGVGTETNGFLMAAAVRFEVMVRVMVKLSRSGYL